MLQTIRYYTPFQEILQKWWYGNQHENTPLIQNEETEFTQASKNLSEANCVSDAAFSKTPRKSVNISNGKLSLSGSYRSCSETRTSVLDKVRDFVPNNGGQANSSNLENITSSSGSNEEDTFSSRLSSSAPNRSAFFNNSNNIKEDTGVSCTFSKKKSGARKRYSGDVLSSLSPRNIVKKRPRRRTKSYGSTHNDNFMLHSSSKDTPEIPFERESSFLNTKLQCRKVCLNSEIKILDLDNKRVKFEVKEYNADRDDFEMRGSQRETWMFYRQLSSKSSSFDSSIELGRECNETDSVSLYTEDSQEIRKPKFVEKKIILLGQHVNDKFLENESFCCQCTIL